MINKGDKVAVLDDAISGIVTKVSGNWITLVTSDGFEMEYEARELIKMGEEISTTSVDLHKAIQDKVDPVKRSFVKIKKEESKEIAFDLHIEKLVNRTKGMQPFEILELQIQTAERHINFAIEKRIPKIVLIHGVGDGKLRAEIEYILRRYENIWTQEASFQRYGQGAIEINFKQNARRVF